MPPIVVNLPWIVIWLVALAVQDRFLRKKNTFGSLIVLWLTLLVGVFWNKVVGMLVPGVQEMWLFGTKIWILFIIVAIRHYLAMRKARRTQAAEPGKPPAEETGSQDTTEE